MTEALIVKISLKGAKPPLWRRVALAPTTTYADLHNIIQLLFNWTNSHLWEFRVNQAPNRTYGDPASADGWAGTLDASQFEVAADLRASNLTYTYDFGDDWQHLIVLEQTQKVDGPLPKVLAARGDGMLEDAGGMADWSELMDADADVPLMNEILLELAGPEVKRAELAKQDEKFLGNQLFRDYQAIVGSDTYNLLQTQYGEALVEDLTFDLLCDFAEIAGRNPGVYPRAKWHQVVNQFVAPELDSTDAEDKARAAVAIMVPAYLAITGTIGGKSTDVMAEAEQLVDVFIVEPLPPLAQTTPIPTHVEQVGKRKWRQATRTRIINELDDIIPELFSVTDADPTLMAPLVKLTDRLYAKHLLTPLNWTPQVLHQELPAILTTVPRDLHAEFEMLMSYYFQVQTELTSMTRSRAQQLQAAVVNVVAAVEPSGRKLKANKQARKILKFQKR